MWLNVGFLSSLISEDLGTDGVERDLKQIASEYR